ncbi:hypothetical protein A3A71_01180 [Candidatus Berkelbacteria bacterium RIFCSPLOWO2_01_FULL_50_28]|uniref:Uncharacterized protein n=1 Tax=Candidatus Berkelbacteria bacterium RIFCSPLOWO2_01_FULL_50_28 TaxID=1797471 RepID=A0A1F5EBH9_9BACT|nr:MAG: hypothetical protein A2807_01750 [Candidatus Berkelbacteria bacterium RIFCSPHIGHO2_01_FULL_50_36]OGD63480.1 MAG: hypothetical protein A3F39_03285 [Candidatus Berkelbacteria bacterium RIFCSPHIGHO2_12_FULL_50_11]OGD64650.1 MAG: hypothetical protein A3A71_01180 [Candidatus Berkelbacteria bacterium RIFCSPLOWO2_01_FULL_50_28]
MRTNSDLILTYIAFCLKEDRFKFSYQSLSNALSETVGKQHSIRTLRKEFSKLKHDGFVGISTRYRKQHPVVTQKGRLRIAPRLAYKAYGPWDGKWRLVITDVPEKEKKYRIQLLSALKELGFEKLRDGVYISPHSLFAPIRRLTSDLGIQQFTTLLETDDIDQEKHKAERIWQLDEINDCYKQFSTDVRKAKKRSSPHWPLTAKELEAQFASIYHDDPHLPTELLPADWHGDRAYKIYRSLVGSY